MNPSDLALFKHKTKVQIRFKDIDKLGHVNNANFLTYFELARVEYVNDSLNLEIDWDKEGIILARIEIDYKSPVYLTDDVWVYCRICKIGVKSFDMQYAIERVEDGNSFIAATGKSVQVCFDYSNGKSMPMPEIWKDAVKNFELSGHLL